jgi:hypothetical protein
MTSTCNKRKVKVASKVCKVRQFNLGGLEADTRMEEEDEESKIG